VSLLFDQNLSRRLPALLAAALPTLVDDFCGSSVAAGAAAVDAARRRSIQ